MTHLPAQYDVTDDPTGALVRPADPPLSEPGAIEPSPPPAAKAAGVRDRLLHILVVGSKLVTIAFGIDALFNHGSRRLRGKAIRTRAVGYVGALFIVPLIWRLLPDRGRYPAELDLAVTTPLFLDAAGNAFGVYEKAHIDDVVHIANSAIVAGVAGALFAPRVDERWQAALAGAGVSVAAESAWEGWEYVAWKLGADGMNLTYDDTMHDIIEGFIGAAIGALFALTRTPRTKAGRRRTGWREPLGA
jgi:hypothetical protein